MSRGRRSPPVRWCRSTHQLALVGVPLARSLQRLPAHAAHCHVPCPMSGAAVRLDGPRVRVNPCTWLHVVLEKNVYPVCRVGHSAFVTRRCSGGGLSYNRSGIDARVNTSLCRLSSYRISPKASKWADLFQRGTRLANYWQTICVAVTVATTSNCRSQRELAATRMHATM